MYRTQSMLHGSLIVNTRGLITHNTIVNTQAFSWELCSISIHGIIGLGGTPFKSSCYYLDVSRNKSY